MSGDLKQINKPAMKKKFNPFDVPKKKKKKTAGGKKAYLLAVKLCADRIDFELF